MTKQLGLALAILLALGLAGCGDDDASGEEGGGDTGGGSGSGSSAGRSGSGSGSSGSGAGSSGSGSGSGSGSAAMCLMAGAGTSEPDPECDTSQYGECVAEACKDEIADCLGPDWESGDFEGSVCESLCAGGATIPPAGCLSCLVGLTSCSSACQSPACALDGSGGGAAGASSGPASDKTCADLEACCEAIDDASTKGVCDQVLAGSKAAGDAACAAAYTNTLFGCE